MDAYNIIKNGKRELEDFLSPYFESSDDLANYLSDVFDYENGNVTKRQMLLQVQRFVSLANEIDKIRPSRDGLRILFLKTGLDSLCFLSGKNNQKTSFYDQFYKCFSDEGENYIISHFKLWLFSDEHNAFDYDRDITLSDFFNIVKATRNKVAHEGDYWSMQFFAYDDDSIWLPSIKTDEKPIKSYHDNQLTNGIVEYHFETTLNYEKFIFYFVEACVKYINDYFNIHKV